MVGFTPFGRSTRFENVWLEIIIVIWRLAIRSRTFWVSGSENARRAAVRRVGDAGLDVVGVGSVSAAPGPPQKPP